MKTCSNCKNLQAEIYELISRCEKAESQLAKIEEHFIGRSLLGWIAVKENVKENP
jgi:hypothetical protein